MFQNIVRWFSRVSGKNFLGCFHNIYIFTDSDVWAGSVIEILLELPCLFVYMSVTKVLIVNNSHTVRVFVFIHKIYWVCMVLKNSQKEPNIQTKMAKKNSKRAEKCQKGGRVDVHRGRYFSLVFLIKPKLLRVHPAEWLTTASSTISLQYLLYFGDWPGLMYRSLLYYLLYSYISLLYYFLYFNISLIYYLLYSTSCLFDSVV